MYSKDGCHLCENVIRALQRINSENSFDLATRDITANPELFEKFKNIIPVVEVDGRVRLAGAALSNPNALDIQLRKALSL